MLNGVCCLMCMNCNDETRKQENSLCAVERPVRLLKDCGPAALSVELTCLTPEGGGASSLLLAFVHMIESMLANGRDFDLAHAYLALFLKVSSQSECCSLNFNSDFQYFIVKYFFFFCFYSSISVPCRRILLPWRHCSASPPIWRQVGRGYVPHLTNHFVCCRTLRVHCCDTLT